MNSIIPVHPAACNLRRAALLALSAFPILGAKVRSHAMLLQHAGLKWAGFGVAEDDHGEFASGHAATLLSRLVCVDHHAGIRAAAPGIRRIEGPHLNRPATDQPEAVLQSARPSTGPAPKRVAQAF